MMGEVHPPPERVYASRIADVREVAGVRCLHVDGRNFPLASAWCFERSDEPGYRGGMRAVFPGHVVTISNEHVPGEFLAGLEIERRHDADDGNW